MALLARAGGDATGYQSSGSAAFIPQLWSPRMVEKFYTKTVFGEIANTNYEGEIKDAGDSVIINTIPSITIRDYAFGAVNGAAGVIPGALQYEKPTSPKVLLEINRAKYFAFECNEIEEYQSNPNLMETFSKDAAEQMKIAVDSDVLSATYLDVAAANTGATAGLNSNINLGTDAAPLVITDTNVINFLINTICTMMDENDYPDEGRWIVLPSNICNLIKTSELKDASLSGDSQSTIRSGHIGRIGDLNIYRSNQVFKVTNVNTTYQVIAGHKSALTFASQMVKMEDLKNPVDFGELVRGLNVYGYKVVKPEAMMHAQIKV